MDSLKGILYSVVILGLIILPSLIDVASMGVAVSQLNKVGAEMIQVVGSEGEYNKDTKKAVEVAKDQYGIDVEFSTTDYGLGDTVELQLTKNITQFFVCEDDTGREGCNADFIASERILITKR